MASIINNEACQPKNNIFRNALLFSACIILLAIVSSCSRGPGVSSWEDRDLLVGRTNNPQTNHRNHIEKFPAEMDKIYFAEYGKVLKATADPNMARDAATNAIRSDGWYRNREKRWVRDTDMFKLDGKITTIIPTSMVFNTNFKIVQRIYFLAASNAIMKGGHEEECIAAARKAVHAHDWYLENGKWQKHGFMEAFQEPVPMAKKSSKPLRLSNHALVNLTPAQRETLNRTGGNSTNTAPLRAEMIMDDNARKAENLFIAAVIAAEGDGLKKSAAIQEGKDAVLKAGWHPESGHWINTNIVPKTAGLKNKKAGTKK